MFARTFFANAGSCVFCFGTTVLSSPARAPNAEPAAAFGVAIATVAVFSS